MKSHSPTWRRHARTAQASPPANDLKKSRRVTRRNERKDREGNKSEEPAKRYHVLYKFSYYDQEETTEGTIQYIGWYDEVARQKRRRSLRLTDRAEAFRIIDRIDASGATGDPYLLLRGVTIDIVLGDYKVHHERGPSAGFNRVAIDKHLSPVLGAILVDRWRQHDLDAFTDAFLERGGSLGYLSRILTVLRAALNEAELRTKKIARAPFIPEVMTGDDTDEAPLKGRLMTTEEIAKLIDAAQDDHLLQYLVGEINSGGRPITTLQTDTSRIDWRNRLFETNPRGRRQNKKYRPLLRIPATWEPWLRIAQSGPLITYDGAPVKSIKKSFAAARKAAGLKPDKDGVPASSYSIRHSLGRWLEDCNVPQIERSLLLGHVKPQRKKSTERYSPTNPYNPNYMAQAVAAIEKFVHEINSYTRKWDLLRPFAVKPGYEDPKRKSTRASRAKAKPEKPDGGGE